MAIKRCPPPPPPPPPPPLVLQPPPPPPPSMMSPKYLITLAPHITVSNVGVTFKPTAYLYAHDCGDDGVENGSRSIRESVGIGASIHSIDLSRQTREWKSKYGMNVGDALYKINGTLVTNMQFDEITNILDERGREQGYGGSNALALIFEKTKTNLTSMNTHRRRETHEGETFPESKSQNGHMNANVTNPKPAATAAPIPESTPASAATPACTTRNTLTSKEMPIAMQSQNKRHLSNFPQHQSRISSSQKSNEDFNRNRDHDHENSIEKNILSSILSPQNNLHTRADDSILSDHSFSCAIQEHGDGNMEQNLHLLAIPEGNGSLTNTDMNMDACDNSKDNEGDVMSIPQQNMISRSRFLPLASPTFSYSVTTVNEEEEYSCAQSPFGGVLTTTSLSNAHASDENHNHDISNISPKHQFHDSQVEMLKQKYAPYLSPNSVMEQKRSCPQSHTPSRSARTIGAGVESVKRNCKDTMRNIKTKGRNHRHRRRMPSGSTSSILSSNDELPCRVIECVPSIESCSISTVFMSPQGHHQVRTPLSSSNFKDNSRKHCSQSSYKDIPISMLDYKFVRECESSNTIEAIVDALRSTSPPEFPSLLRLAERRLVELRPNPAADGDHSDLDDYDRNTVIVKEKTSGIPSHIHVEVQTNVDSELHVDDYKRESDDREEYNSDQEVHEGNDMDEILMAHAELKSQMNDLLQERDTMQGNLSSQVESLEALLADVKIEMKKKLNESNDKLNLLRNQKAQSEIEMSTIRESCATASINKQELVNNLKAKEAEIGDLAAEMFKVQDSKRADLELAECVQNKLRSQVENLTNLLKEQKQRTEATRKMAEVQIKEKSKLVEDLNSKLKATSDDVHMLYKENKFMATEFAKFGLRFENPIQFRELLKEFAAAEACANALAKALTESEMELSSIVWENKKSREQIEKLEKENTRLSTKNEELSTRIFAIDQELMNSNKLIDNLHKDINTYQFRQKNYEKIMKKCKAATELYKVKVSRLRSQLTDEGNVVPLEVYKKAVISSQSLKEALVQQESEVKVLTARICHLECMVEKKNSHKILEDKKFEKNSTNNQKIDLKSCNAPRRGTIQSRAALVEKIMKKPRASQLAKGILASNKTREVAPLGSHDRNILPSKYVYPTLSTSTFVSIGGKEN